jgi:hypothetical protein
MKRRTVVGSVGAAALGVVGVSAYTNATVSRASSLSISDDTGGVIQFISGEGASIENGKLELNSSENRFGIAKA